MLRRDGLLGLALRYLVGFGGYEGDEFDTAVDEQVPGISGEGDARFSGIIRGEDFGNNLLHGCFQDGC